MLLLYVRAPPPAAAPTQKATLLWQPKVGNTAAQRMNKQLEQAEMGCQGFAAGPKQRAG